MLQGVSEGPWFGSQEGLACCSPIFCLYVTERRAWFTISAINVFNLVHKHHSSMGLIFGFGTASNPVLQVCVRDPCFLVWWVALIHIIILALDGLLVVLVVLY